MQATLTQGSHIHEGKHILKLPVNVFSKSLQGTHIYSVMREPSREAAAMFSPTDFHMLVITWAQYGAVFIINNIEHS